MPNGVGDDGVVRFRSDLDGGTDMASQEFGNQRRACCPFGHPDLGTAVDPQRDVGARRREQVRRQFAAIDIDRRHSISAGDVEPPIDRIEAGKVPTSAGPAQRSTTASAPARAASAIWAVPPIMARASRTTAVGLIIEQSLSAIVQCDRTRVCSSCASRTVTKLRLRETRRCAKFSRIINERY